MNEYPDVYGETLVKGRLVANQSFLKNFRQADACSIKAFFNLADMLTGFDSTKQPEDDVQRASRYKKIDLNRVQGYLDRLIRSDALEPLVRGAASSDKTGGQRYDPSPESCIANIRNIDAEGVKQFYLANVLEYTHQNIARGQINHFGHILNPINEYRLGKPIRDIYAQYGIGNTFLLKWTMELFGDISIQTYYKTYVFYIVYYLAFLLMLMYLFKDDIFVLGAYAIVPACFFLQGYIALVLAPGIIPSIHLFDTSVIICLIAFYRRNNPLYLAFATALALASILINRQFGVAVFAALTISVGLYIVENKRGKGALLWVVAALCTGVIAIPVWRFSEIGGSSEIFPYFWKGFLSWPALPQVIIFTLIYLVLSYGFLLLLKKTRVYLKYVYLFVFVYAQTLLLYFFWSGLPNHLPLVVPFLWVQLLLMLFIAKETLLRNPLGRKSIYATVIVFTMVGCLAIAVGALDFYKEKSAFAENFRLHRTYAWQIPRARLIATVNPEVVQEAVDLIRHYSPEKDMRVYILSKYDSLLPFLSDRYSAMPFFEVSAFLFSEKEYRMVLNRLKDDKPRYLIVDTNIADYTSDRWANVYPGRFFARERASRLGRYELLYRLFQALSRTTERSRAHNS